MEKICENCSNSLKVIEPSPCSVCYWSIDKPNFKEKEKTVESHNKCFSEWEEKEKTVETHYKTGEYECIAVMIDVFGKEAVMHFAMLNAFKYVWRNEHKGHAKDLKKAKDYIELYLELDGE